MGGGGGTHFFVILLYFFLLLFESHLRTFVLENFISNVAQATFYTEIVEFLARAM